MLLAAPINKILEPPERGGQEQEARGTANRALDPRNPVTTRGADPQSRGTQRTQNPRTPDPRVACCSRRELMSPDAELGTGLHSSSGIFRRGLHASPRGGRPRPGGSTAAVAAINY